MSWHSCSREMDSCSNMKTPCKFTNYIYGQFQESENWQYFLNLPCHDFWIILNFRDIQCTFLLLLITEGTNEMERAWITDKMNPQHTSKPQQEGIKHACFRNSMEMLAYVCYVCKGKRNSTTFQISYQCKGTLPFHCWKGFKRKGEWYSKDNNPGGRRIPSIKCYEEVNWSTLPKGNCAALHQ